VPKCRFPNAALNPQAVVKATKIGNLTDLWAQVVDITQTTITVMTVAVGSSSTIDGNDGIWWSVLGY